MDTPLLYLTDRDWQELHAHRREIRYGRDEVVVREGVETPGVMILKSGSLRVEQELPALRP